MLRILRRCRSRRRDQGPVEPLPPHELLSFGMDVAKGMRHLSTYKVNKDKSLGILKIWETILGCYVNCNVKATLSVQIILALTTVCFRLLN